MGFEPNRDLFVSSFYDSQNDRLGINMRNVDTGEKNCVIIDKPKMDLYIYKKPLDYYKEFVLKKDCDVVQVSYKWKMSEVARLMGIDRDTYKNVIRQDKTKMKQLQLTKNIFGMDINIEDHYLMKYMDGFPKHVDANGYDEYDDTPPIRNVHKGYLDAEWDISVSDVREEQPIYLITYTDGLHKVSYTYYLYNPEYGNIDSIEEDKEGFIQRMKDRVNSHIQLEMLKISHAKAVKIQPMLQAVADKMQYIIKKYDDEEQMLKDMYQLVYRKYKPDFLLIYNAAADIGQTMLRYRDVYGGDCKDLFTCPELGDYYDMNMDDDRFEPSERNHVYNSASYTKLICSYQQYHTLRRTVKYSNRGLGDVALREIGVGKLSFKHICSTIHDLPYKDFPLTMEYNIRDVVLMDFLETCISDVEYTMSLRFLKTVDYNRVYIPIVCSYNVFYHISLRNGKIMANNINRILLKLTEEELEYFKTVDPITYKLAIAIKNRAKIEGGLCSAPTKFKGPSRKHMLSFLPSLTLKHVIDIDATSEYPNAIISGMMAKSTIYGRLIKIADDESEFDNMPSLRTGKDIYSYTGALINRDYIGVCREFFNLPGTQETLQLIKHAKIKAVKKRSSTNRTFEDMYSIIDKERFTKLHKVLSKVLNPKQDTKDIEIGEIPMRSVYIATNDTDNRFKYNGSMIAYKIVEKDSLAEVSPLSYICYSGDEDTLVIDGTNKEIDNTIIDDLRIDDIDVNPIVNKPCELIGSVDLTDDISSLCNPKRLTKTTIDLAGTRLSIPSRFIAFPSSLITDDFYKIVKTASQLPKDIVYITPKSRVSLSLSDDSTMTVGECDFELKNNKYILDIINDNSVLIMSNKKGVSKTYNFNVLRLDYKVYKVKDIGEDNIYKGIFSYNIPIDDNHVLFVSQEFFFVNYIEHADKQV